MLLPRDPDGAPPVGDSAVCFGSVMINVSCLSEIFIFFMKNFSITKNMNLICFWIHLMKSDHVMGISETIQTNPPFQQRDITEKNNSGPPPVCAYLLPEPPKLRRIFYLFASKNFC